MKTTFGRWAMGLCGALMLVAVTGCGGDQVRDEDGKPKWVNQGSAAFKDGSLYAVGAVGNVSSVSLRRSTADAQARTELAKIFTSRVQNLIKNYEASTGDGEREAAEAHRQEASKVFTEMELHGVQIVDRFFDERDNTQYALARLDNGDFEKQLEDMKSLGAQAKKIIRDNAKKAFDEIDAESARRND